MDRGGHRAQSYPPIASICKWPAGPGLVVLRWRPRSILRRHIVADLIRQRIGPPWATNSLSAGIQRHDGRIGPAMLDDDSAERGVRIAAMPVGSLASLGLPHVLEQVAQVLVATPAETPESRAHVCTLFKATGAC